MCEASFEAGVVQDSRCAICCFADSRLKGVEKGGGGALQRSSRTGGYSCFRFFLIRRGGFFFSIGGALLDWSLLDWSNGW